MGGKRGRPRQRRLHVALALAAALGLAAFPLALGAVATGRAETAALGVETLLDRGGALTAEQLLSPPWSSLFARSGGPVSLGVGPPPAWVRLELANDSGSEQVRHLSWDFPLIHRLELHAARDGRVVQRAAGGLAVPVAERTIAFQGSGHRVTLRLPPRSRTTVLLRAEAPGSLFVSLSSWEGSDRTPPGLDPQLPYGVGLGVVLVLASLALAQFAAWRDPSHLWYALFVAGYGLYGATMTGLAPLVLWPESPHFAVVAQPLFSGITGLFGALFARSYLGAGAHDPRASRLLLGLGLANLASGLLGFAHLVLANALTALAATTTLALGMGLAVKALRQGPRQARWFLLGFGLFAGMGALFALAVVGLLRPTPLLLWGLQGSFALTGISLALAIVERRSEESEELIRLAFETSPDPIALNRVADGVYVAINQSFTRVTGWASAELMGRSSLEVHIWDDPADRERLVGLLRREGTARNVEFRFRLKGGRTGIGLMSARLVQLRGQPLILSITRDITELREAEVERSRLQEELRQAQKMEAIGRLAGGIAHDFNNVLTAISTNAGLGMADARPEDPARPLFEEIREAVQQATGLTRQLLTFARRQRVSFRAVALGPLLEGMRKLLTRLIGEDVRLELRPSPELLAIQADGALVEQVVMNLVVNARDALGPGGSIVVETRAATLTTSGPDRPAGGYAVLSVRDDGQGMDPETLSHIFEPFFTTKPGARGTGIGLATVYGIARQHGGFIEVRSEKGRGSTFEVWWPMSAGAPTPQGRAPPSGPPSLPGGSETLLFAEDEERVRQPTLALLRRLGYQVLAAADGAEALALSRAHPGAIDLVLTDVVMPRMDGGELVTRLRQERPGIRVLFLSGYDDQILSRRGFDDAGAELLPKPFTVEDLAGRLRAVLGRPA